MDDNNSSSNNNMKSETMETCPSTPPRVKRTSSEITPSNREKSAQRQLSSSLATARKINHGNDDVVPPITKSTRNSHTLTKQINKPSKNNKTSTSTSKITNKPPLQCSIKSYFLLSEDCPSVPRDAITIPIPSSTTLSSDIAPDPSASTEENQWEIENEQNETFLFDGDGQVITPSDEKETITQYEEEEEEKQKDKSKVTHAKLEFEEEENILDRDDIDHDSNISDQGNNQEDEDEEEVSQSNSEDSNDDYSEYTEEEEEDEDDSSVYINKVVPPPNKTIFLDSDDSDEESEESDEEVSEAEGLPSYRHFDGGSIMEKRKIHNTSPLQGEILESEDLNNYVVSKQDGSITNLKAKEYYNSNEVKDQQYDQEYDQIMEQEREKKAYYLDKKQNKEDEEQYDSQLEEPKEENEVTKDEVSNVTNTVDTHDNPSKRNMETEMNEEENENGSDTNKENTEERKQTNPNEENGTSTNRSNIPTQSSETNDKESEKEDPNNIDCDNGTTENISDQHQDTEMGEEESKEDNSMIVDANDPDNDAEMKDKNSEEKEDNNGEKDDANSVATEKMGTNWGTTGPPPSHDQNNNTTEQDELNSINSGETTHKMSAEEAEKEKVPPLSIRYQFSFELETENPDDVKKALANTPTTAPLVTLSTYPERLRNEIKSALEEMKKIDKDSCIISWADANTFSTFRYDEETKLFPSATADITTYFPGYRPNVNTDEENKPKKRFVASYIKMRIHHPRTQSSIFEEKMSTWAILNSKRFKVTIIQTPNPKTVGWFLYSSQYTDTQYLKKLLQSTTGYEWGFRLTPVTDADKLTPDKKIVPYKDRVKALAAVVDQKYADEIALHAALRLFVSRDIRDNIYSFVDRFSFVDPSFEKANSHKSKIFIKMVERQKIHSEELIAIFCPWIDGDIDRQIFTIPANDTSKPDISVSLRQLVLSIPRMQKDEYESDNETDTINPEFEPLFQGFDFTPNSSLLWFDGTKGPGGPGYVLTSYKNNRGEAEAMARGMGLYFATKYPNNKKILAKTFSASHWRSLHGWSWNEEEKSFINAESAYMYQNLLHDKNTAMVRASDKKLVETQAKEAKALADKERKKKATEYLKNKKKEQDARKKDKTYLAAAKALEKSQVWTKEKKKASSTVIDAKDMLNIKIRHVKRQQFNDNGSIDMAVLGKNGEIDERIMDHIHMSDNVSTTSSITINSHTTLKDVTDAEDVGNTARDTRVVGSPAAAVGTNAESTTVAVGSTVPVEDKAKAGDKKISNDIRQRDDHSIESLESDTSSIKSFDDDFLDNLIDKATEEKDMTEEELFDMADAALLMKVKRAVVKKRTMIARRLKQKGAVKPSTKEAARKTPGAKQAEPTQAGGNPQSLKQAPKRSGDIKNDDAKPAAGTVTKKRTRYRKRKHGARKPSADSTQANTPVKSNLKPPASAKGGAGKSE